VLVEQTRHVLAVIEVDGALDSVFGEVHADDARELTMIYDVKLRVHEGNKGYPLDSVIARNMDVVDINRNHGEDPFCRKDVYAWVKHEMPQDLRDKPVSK
jgi:hypothetical protein